LINGVSGGRNYPSFLVRYPCPQIGGGQTAFSVFILSSPLWDAPRPRVAFVIGPSIRYVSPTSIYHRPFGSWPKRIYENGKCAFT
jgi:hypothetical protein